jgi:hypothetical protein
MRRIDQDTLSYENLGLEELEKEFVDYSYLDYNLIEQEIKNKQKIFAAEFYALISSISHNNIEEAGEIVTEVTIYDKTKPIKPYCGYNIFGSRKKRNTAQIEEIPVVKKMVGAGVIAKLTSSPLFTMEKDEVLAQSEIKEGLFFCCCRFNRKQTTESRYYSVNYNRKRTSLKRRFRR